MSIVRSVGGKTLIRFEMRTLFDARLDASGVSAVTGGANQTARAALFVINRTGAKPRTSQFSTPSRADVFIISHMGHASEGDKIHKVPGATFLLT